MRDVRRLRPLSPAVLIISGMAVALLLAVAGRYGYHRDEVYFLAAARRLAWGYVDQPPLTVGVAWLADALFGASLIGLRLFPALATGATALIAGLTARRLGGGPPAQATAALGIAGGGFFLGSGHLLSTATFDTLLWAMVLFLVVRLFQGADDRLWLLLGLVVGIGLLNKHTMLFLVFGLLTGVLISAHHRPQLRSPWLWGGVGIALAAWSPNLLWQVQNDWPTLEMIGSLQEEHSGVGAALEFIGLQVVAVSFVFIVPALAGLRWLLRDAEATALRPIGIAYLVLFGLFLVFGGQFYYVAPLYVVLLAAGGLWVERKVAAGASRRVLGGAAAVAIVAALPFALPILPVSAIDVPNGLNAELGETVGWPALTDQVASVAMGLEPDAMVFTGSYGEAGALELLGAERGLPPVYSGHNGYWRWGPPVHDGPVIGVGYVRWELEQVCADTRQVAVIDNGVGIDNEEQGQPIWLCTVRTGPWSDIWEDVRHYN